jgi:hypothetical protein
MAYCWKLKLFLHLFFSVLSVQGVFIFLIAKLVHPMANLFEISSFKTGKFGTTIWVVKMMLLCVGIISTFILFKVAIIPCTFNLILSTLPSVWISLRGWLSPPYIYIILNFIIIAIVASFIFQHPTPTCPILVLIRNTKVKTKVTRMISGKTIACKKWKNYWKQLCLLRNSSTVLRIITLLTLS